MVPQGKLMDLMRKTSERLQPFYDEGVLGAAFIEKISQFPMTIKGSELITNEKKYSER
jgi:hypothetical protein